MLTAFLTAKGRIHLGLEQALSSRYATATLIFWVSTLFLMWSMSRTRVARRVQVVSVAALALFAAGTQWPLLKAVEQTALYQRENETIILSGVSEPNALNRIFPVPDFVLRQVKVMRERRLSIFALPWSDWLGSPIEAHAKRAAAEACAGYIDEIMPVVRGDAVDWRARGWAWDRSARDVPEAIILTQADGIIVGYGLLGWERPDVARALLEVSMLRTGWVGYFSVARPTSLRAYALLKGGGAVCPLKPPDFPVPGALDGQRPAD